MGHLILNWIRYSGVSIILVLNPLHWRLTPWCRRDITSEWSAGPAGWTGSAGFLCLTIRVWVDDGSW